MNYNLNLLVSEIDELRNKLYQLLLYNSLTDDKVVTYSQKLDKLLVEYHNARKLLKKAS